MNGCLLKSERIQASVEDTPLVVLELRAAATQLRTLGAYLADLAAERGFCQLEPVEVELAGKAEVWAGRVYGVAEEIRKAVAE